MFKKKSRLPLILAAVVTTVIVLIVYVLPEVKQTQMSEIQETEETESETEQAVSLYEILIHKTNAGTIEFKEEWLESDNDSETCLLVEADKLVSMKVSPKEGKLLDKVNIYDASNVDNSISSVITPMDNGVYNIDFTMPDTNIVMTFGFANEESSEEPDQQELETEAETETEASPYGLTLHGVTADLIISFNGQFDDRDFLQQLGDALHMDSVRSDYYSVSDVTFSTEEYTGEKDSDKVYCYIYFNNDSDWKVLSTYYLKEQTYVFTEPPKETEEVPVTESQETETSAVTADSGNESSASTGTTGTSTETAAAGETYTTTTQGETQTVSTSFDIMQVSTVFLAFTGDSSSTFYDQTFQYVLSKGLTGSIIGTMTSYEIDPEKQQATFSIALNTGASISGTYTKRSDSYSFSGL